MVSVDGIDVTRRRSANVRWLLPVVLAVAVAWPAAAAGSSTGSTGDPRPARSSVHAGAPSAASPWARRKAEPDVDVSAVIARAWRRAAARARSLRGDGRERDGAGIDTESELREAWTDPRRTRIDLTGSVFLRNCHIGDPIRESPYPLVLDGHGFAVRQTCFEKRLLRQDGTGYLELRHVQLSRGGSDGPGAAVTTRGEITLVDCVVTQNLAEEPGGGIFSMRRATVRDSYISGNLANDDGGGVYARRGGVQVYDSVISNNLVDGSGGAVGSTGDILIVRSRVDGNTTDGDGGALYTDEAGDVTVIDSSVDGNDADGPGGAIFTLDGDVAIAGSTLVGNRADDRGGAISGEADVLVVNSTLARNLAVAHVGGGAWARGGMLVVNSTVTDNYAEGEGGGLITAGPLTLVASTVSSNIASVGANLGVGQRFSSFGSIIGPAMIDVGTGDTRRTRLSCRVYEAVSSGFNLVTDPSCSLADSRDVTTFPDPLLAALEDDPAGRVMMPLPTSPARGIIPSGTCLPLLPTPVPAGQLLATDADTTVDWPDLLSRDQVGGLRDSGRPCDLGAAQTGAVR